MRGRSSTENIGNVILTTSGWLQQHEQSLSMNRERHAIGNKLSNHWTRETPVCGLRDFASALVSFPLFCFFLLNMPAHHSPVAAPAPAPSAGSCITDQMQTASQLGTGSDL